MREEIELRLPAEADQLSMLRTVAGAVAMRADFDLDAIADLKIAVDEACSMLIMKAAKSAVLCCRFDTTDHQIRVAAEVATDGDPTIDESAFGWHVLTTLSDAVSWAVADAGRTGLCLELIVRRKADRP